MAFPEVYTALRESRIDGQETPLTIIQSSRFSEVQRHLTLTGHVYSPLVYVMNRDSFAMLSADQKASLLAAAKAGAALTRKVAAESEQQILEGLKTQGMQVVDAVDHEAFAKALAPAMPEFARRFGADTIARVRDTR
jgi:TRAP-type C4-dicarboxylate transport system substrate-binding protein